MSDPREIRSLLQRTPGDPLGPPYDRAPAGRPPMPPFAWAALRPVLVWRDGGATDGTITLQCDRTYTVKTLDAGTTLGTGMTPAKRRPIKGRMDTPPTGGNGVVGLGYYEDDGTFCLYDANECVYPGPCPEP